jgi:hypothetical protein
VVTADSTTEAVPPGATAALADLHRARRHNHRAVVHWVDALYRVYLTGLGAAIVVVVASGLLPHEPLDPAGVEALAAEGPAWLGLAIAAALAFGLRSGSRGGPLTLEAATVQHELLAPLPQAVVLRGSVFKQLRFLAFAGTVVGGIVGVLTVRRLPENEVAGVVCTAATFALAAAAAAGIAYVASGRRLSRWAAGLLALGLLGWSALDITAGLTTSPATMLASLAFAPLSFDPLAVVGVLAASLTVAAGVGSLSGLSVETARRRAGLVSQLRFAVTLQDIRTVVLLRRQLAQETPRTRPWIRLKRGGRLPAVWRRDWHSYFRFPAVRVARLVTLAVVAGLALGFTWRGAAPAFLVAAVTLYLAAYDAVEPVAQEVDHPTRWDDLAVDPGRQLLLHLPAALTLMVLLCLVSAASALVLVPASVVADLTPVLVVPVALTAVAGAAVSTTLGAPDTAALVGMGADMMGLVLMLRLVLPPAMVVAALAPVLGAGSDPADLQVEAVSNNVTYSVFFAAAGLLWLRFRKPNRI